jgi:hypothetical protein
MFQFTCGGAERHGVEGGTPHPHQIIPMKGEVSNRSLFLMKKVRKRHFLTEQPVAHWCRWIGLKKGAPCRRPR